MQAASGWMRKYFDLTSKPVQSALATLSQETSIAMPGDMPDLGASLDAVRALKVDSERIPERAPARAK